MGDALSPQAGSQRDEVVDVDVDVSQDGQALPSSIEASQVLATVEDQLYPPDGDSTHSTTQPPRPSRDLSLNLP